MQIARVSFNRKMIWGKVSNEYFLPLCALPWLSLKLSGKKIPLKNVKFTAPYEGGKVILAGLNYKDHAKEMNMAIPSEPVIFIKPSTAVIGPQDDIIYPCETKDLHHEAELAFMIKKEGKNISQKDAGKYILGFTCLNDVTARDIQKIDGQWTRAKGFDTFCPLGPFIETDYDWRNKNICLSLNENIKQNSNTVNLIFSPEYLVEFISNIMTLYPGDIISTGTPFGVGPMNRGDEVCVDIEGIGQLRNRIR